MKPEAYMIEKLTIDTIRILSAESVEKAKSGHPGLPMGAAAFAYTLWTKHMNHSPKNPKWENRDRFVLSAGHGSMLLYSLLHLSGYDLSIDDLKNFRQLGSKTPGHPEYGHTEGVETTTGPLGQGFANAVGMAMAEVYKAAIFNRPGFDVVDNYTYCISGDGCMMEGVASEAASLAGTLRLGKLIVLYDSNSITIEGGTDLAFNEDVGKRFEAYGWQVLKVDDGNDVKSVDDAITAAKAEKYRPSLVIITTSIGFGCPAKQGKASAHGEPLGKDNLDATKRTLEWFHEPFHVPAEVKEHMIEVMERNSQSEVEWNKLLEAYRATYPDLANEWDRWQRCDLPVDLLNNESFWKFEGKSATRNSSGEIINRIAGVLPNLIGGSADLAPSTKTLIKGSTDYSASDRRGRNLRFGVREHAMAAIANGIALYGGLRVYTATFFVFTDYMKPAMRLSALMNLPVIYVLTHDSIGVGEDGPTHQPIEHLAALRSIPNMVVIRPADSKETAAGWLTALTRTDGPTALVLTRQDLPLYEETGKEALKGAYILTGEQWQKPDIILLATGSEVELAYEAGKILKDNDIKVRVVSMPSWELFEMQDDGYKEHILPKSVKTRLAIEMGCSMGWHKYTGFEGDIIAIDTFGLSGPAKMLFNHFGFTVDKVVERAMRLLGQK
jgi:transketolase